MLGDRKTVVLRGGTPWGFRLFGGGQTAIYIAKVRSRSKASLAGLAAGDTLLSINGISSQHQSLREVNDIIDTIRDQLILEVQSTGSSRGVRLDSSSSIDTRENSPVRSIHRITPQAKPMDYPRYTPNRTTNNYSPFSIISNSNTNNNNNASPIPHVKDYQHQQPTAYNNQNHYDYQERSSNNQSPSIFRMATVTSNSPSTSMATRARVQQFSPHQIASSHNNYDTPRNYSSTLASGYMSDTNDLRRSSISLRPSSSIAQLQSRLVVNQQPTSNYEVKVSTNQNENSYYSDSEYVSAGPRYYKISRQVNSSARRPSNVVLPIRSMISKTYEPYVAVEPSPPIETNRVEPIVITPRVAVSPKLTVSTSEMGAELMKSPIADKKRYADSSFFKTTYNTYPTIDDQKTMARKIASILQGGDPTQKGSTKFEKQRQRAEKYAVEREALSSPHNPTSYRPLRPLQQTVESRQQPKAISAHIYSSSSPLPTCIKNSLDQAQYINPLRYVGAPEEFKQMHMQEHVTHTSVPPQAAMNIVSDLNSSRDRGAALFQRRRARSEKWIIDENNVKKVENSPQNPTTTMAAPVANNKPWGQFASSIRSSEDESIRASPVRVSIVTEAPQHVPRYSDFNAKPKGFGSWTSDHSRSQSPRAPLLLDGRKMLNLNIEPSIREGIAESHTRNNSQSWSPPTINKPFFNYSMETASNTNLNNNDGIQRTIQSQARSNPSNHFNAFSASSPHFTDL